MLHGVLPCPCLHPCVALNISRGAPKGTKPGWNIIWRTSFLSGLLSKLFPSKSFRRFYFHFRVSVHSLRRWGYPSPPSAPGSTARWHERDVMQTLRAARSPRAGGFRSAEESSRVRRKSKNLPPQPPPCCHVGWYPYSDPTQPDFHRNPEWSFD